MKYETVSRYYGALEVEINYSQARYKSIARK